MALNCAGSSAVPLLFSLLGTGKALGVRERPQEPVGVGGEEESGGIRWLAIFGQHEKEGYLETLLMDCHLIKMEYSQILPSHLEIKFTALKKKKKLKEKKTTKT